MTDPVNFLELLGFTFVCVQGFVQARTGSRECLEEHRGIQSPLRRYNMGYMGDLIIIYPKPCSIYAKGNYM